jgi:sortase A
LQITDGKDYCTLVTCTPYGINTHRLLVRGHRIENAQGEMSVIADGVQIEPVYVAPAVAAPMLIILLILLVVMTSEPFRKKGRKD